MTATARTDVHPAVRRARGAMRGQACLLVAILFAVTWTDQVGKAWAWRHLPSAHVNSGGDLLVGPVVGSWFQNRVIGAVFDVADAALLVAAGLLIARRRRPVGVLASAAVLLAGWSSNLLDRLGLHYWTAPGSRRGVVDFIPFDGRYWNLADVAIVAGSVLLVVFLIAAGVRAGLRAALGSRRPVVTVARRPLAGTWARVAVSVGVVATGVLAVIGAVSYGYIESPAVLLAAPR